MNNKSVLYNNRGLAYYHSRKLMEAKKDFDDAIELDPLDSTIFFNRGNAFLNWEPQLFDLAHKDYDEALSLAPYNAKIWHSKGLAFQS
jgi:tetratricopeptide (TPR) repeat protein